MQRALFLATAASLVLSTPALAQDDPDGESEVEQIVVTATRLPAPIDVTPGAYVIDETRIEASGAVFAAELLGQVPGVSLYSQGAPGGVASIRLRGAGQDKTLVLLDGVPLNDPSQPAGGYDFAALELGDIARVEVLNGPQGSLWGSDAIGGVVALTSRELDGARLDLEGGSLGTARASGAWGVSAERHAVGLAVSAFRTDGVSRAEAADGNAEPDGFENLTASLNGRIDVGPVSLDGRLRRNAATAEIDGYPAPLFALADTAEISETESLSGFLRARGELAGIDHSLTWARSEIDRAIAGGALPSRYTGGRTLWRWQADAGALEDRVALAFGLEREDTQGDLSTGVAERLGATSAFAAARFEATDRLTASLSARIDDPDEYEAETTLRAGLAYGLGEGFTLSAAWGQGFKTPTISQTLCDFCFALGPYPTLRPERAEGVDLGLAWRSSDGRTGLRATVYRLEIEDEISFFLDPGTFESYYVNLARTHSRGLEVQVDWRLGERLGFTGAYAYTDAEDAATGARLLRVPEHSGSVTIDWSDGPWRGALTVRGESEQADAGGTREGFVIARFAGGYALSQTAELTLRLENLTDEAYQEVLGYGEPGRAAYLGLRLRY